MRLKHTLPFVIPLFIFGIAVVHDRLTDPYAPSYTASVQKVQNDGPATTKVSLINFAATTVPPTLPGNPSTTFATIPPTTVTPTLPPTTFMPPTSQVPTSTFPDPTNATDTTTTETTQECICPPNSEVTTTTCDDEED